MIIRSALLLRISTSTAAIAALAVPVMAHAQQRAVVLDIPAQDLGAALKAIASATGQQVAFKGSVVRGKRSNAVRGTYSADEAIAIALRGSGLSMSRTQRGIIVVEPSAVAEPTSAPTASSLGEQSETNEIVVTGTHIPGVANDTAATMTISRKYIEQSGLSTTQQLFDTLPQNFRGGSEGASEDGIFGAGANKTLNYTRASGINLRGLGNSSTLTLLNGHRLAPTSFGRTVDISLIPLSAIERIEILTDGSSAIYGSDAIGGVVNTILRDDYDGAETRIRYGTVTEGSREEVTLSQTFGSSWATGNLLLSGQYQSFGRLSAADRSYTSGLDPRNDLYPQTKTYSIIARGRQEIGDRLTFTSDILASRRKVHQNSASIGDVYPTEATPSEEQFSVNSGLTFKASERWSVALNGQYSRDKTRNPQSNPSLGTALFDGKFNLYNADLIVSGSVPVLPSRDLGIAVGASIRGEHLRYTQTGFGTYFLESGADRSVKAAFAELYLPVFSPDLGINGLHELNISSAVRLDDYSDFGSTVNFRGGIAYAPFDGLKFRASYSEAFRAPNAAEMIAAQGQPNLLAINLNNPSGSGTVPVFVLRTSGQPLKPERAKTWSFGIDVEPKFAEGLRLSANYYYIDYRDRIQSNLSYLALNLLSQRDRFAALITDIADDAAAAAYLNALLARGGTFIDATGGTGSTGVRYLFDASLRNTARVKQEGVDINIRYSKSIGDGTIAAQVGANFISRIDTAISDAGTTFDISDTVNNPVSPKIRADLNWADKLLSANIGVNHQGGYVNTELTPNTKIESWTTVDLRLAFNIDAISRSPALGGTTLALSVQNLLNTNPPYVTPTSLRRVSYDPANASGLGRFVAIEIVKKW